MVHLASLISYGPSPKPLGDGPLVDLVGVRSLLGLSVFPFEGLAVEVDVALRCGLLGELVHLGLGEIVLLLAGLGGAVLVAVRRLVGVEVLRLGGLLLGLLVAEGLVLVGLDLDSLELPGGPDADVLVRGVLDRELLRLLLFLLLAPLRWAAAGATMRTRAARLKAILRILGSSELWM